MVPNARLELARPFGHNHLKVACLPIPPAGHWVNVFLSNTGVIIHQFFTLVKHYLQSFFKTIS